MIHNFTSSLTTPDGDDDNDDNYDDDDDDNDDNDKDDDDDDHQLQLRAGTGSHLQSLWGSIALGLSIFGILIVRYLRSCDPDPEILGS